MSHRASDVKAFARGIKHEFKMTVQHEIHNFEVSNICDESPKILLAIQAVWEKKKLGKKTSLFFQTLDAVQSPSGFLSSELLRVFSHVQQESKRLRGTKKKEGKTAQFKEENRTFASQEGDIRFSTQFYL